MSLYLCMGLILLFGTLLEYINKKTPNKYFVASFFLLACMHCLRYGQGTDYFGYMRIYDAVAKARSISTVINSTAHSEWGWKLFCWFFAKIGFEFKYFIAIISAFECFLLYRFIKKYCPLNMFALLLIYPTMYLTYMQSAIRQGFVLCVFFGYLLEKFLEKSYIKYYIVTIIMLTLHLSACVFLVLPLFNWKKDWNVGYIIVLFIMAFLLGIANYMGLFNSILTNLFPSLGYYVSKREISVMTIAERLMTYGVVMYLYYIYKSKRKKDLFITCIVSLYTFGTALYLLFMGMPIVASRLAYVFKCLEIIILTNILLDAGKARSLFFIYFILLSIVMYTKNINSYLEYGRYFNHVNIVNYPYFTIFDSLGEVRNYRELIWGIDIN